MASAQDKYSNTKTEPSSTHVFHRKYVAINLRLFFTLTQTPPRVREVSWIDQTKGLKIFTNIKMWWLSMLSPTMKVMNKYPTLLIEMQQHSSTLANTKTNFDHLTSVHILVGLACFLPMLQSMHNFKQFAQKCDVFVFNYLFSIKICQVNVYAMYNDPTTTYTHD